MRKVFLFFRWLIVGVTALLGSAIISTVPAVAQEAAQSTSTNSDITNASNASRFQDAASKFQQSDNSAANTAAGSASILRQENNGSLTVDGAPANSGATTANNSTAKLWLTVILFATAGALLIAYIYSKRSAKATDTKAEALLAEMTVETPKKSSKKAKSSDESSESKPKSKKSTKKKKNKKHHR